MPCTIQCMCSTLHFHGALKHRIACYITTHLLYTSQAKYVQGGCTMTKPQTKLLYIFLQGHAEGAMPGFIGSCSYSQRNLFGLNQKLTAALEAGQSDSTFRISHTDPWVRGDAHRTSRTISLQNNKTSGALALHASDARTQPVTTQNCTSALL